MSNDQTLSIDLSGRLGLAPKFFGDIDKTTSSPNLRILASNGMMAEGTYNPFRKYGYMSAANTAFRSFYGPTSSDYIQANITCSIVDLENSGIYIGPDGRYLYKATNLDGQTNSATAVDLGNNNYKIKDLEIYQVNGVRKLFVVYDKNGTLDIAISNLPYDTATDNLTWLTGTVSGAFSNTYIDAFMRVADNGYAYLFNGNQVHKVDGTTTSGGSNGTVTANSLLFPVTFRIMDAIDNKGSMFLAIRETPTTLGTNKSGTTPCGVYVWDRSTTTSSPQDYIRVTGVKDIRRIFVAPSGNMRIIVINADDIAEIREYNGNTFIPVLELGQNNYPLFRDSFTVANKFAIWAAMDGYIYAYGSPYLGDPEGVFRIGKTPTTDFLNAGAIIYVGDSEFTGTGGFKAYRIGLFYSYRENSSSDMYIKIWDMYGVGKTGATGTQSTTPIYTPVYYLPQMSTVSHIDIYMAPLATGSSSTAATVSIYLNQSATAWANKAITLDDCARGYKRIEVNKQYVNAIQLSITHGGVAMGDSEFFPSLANVYWSPTPTKG